MILIICVSSLICLCITPVLLYFIKTQIDKTKLKEKQQKYVTDVVKSDLSDLPPAI